MLRFRPKTAQRAIIRRCFIGCVIVIVIAAAGLQLRRWTWAKTEQIRFQHDIDNGLYWGNRVIEEGETLTGRQMPADGFDSWKVFFTGYFALYDQVKREAYGGDYHLDYPPLRLLVMALWAKHTRRLHPDANVVVHPEAVMPMLGCNLFCEAGGTVAMFLLVRIWIRRDSNRAPPFLLRRVSQEDRGWVAGLLAASLVWLNPSVILEAYGWPQWDVWVLPFFLFAALTASLDRWLCCGCILALGGMLKGQLLLVAPFFVLWPIWLCRWKAAFHVLLGFAATAAGLVSPWLLHNNFDWLQVGFLYGTEHYPQLFISSCYNLPALLARSGWSLKDALVNVDVGWLSVSLTVQWALRLLYFGGLAACARFAAHRSQRSDARVLLALGAPWLLMFGLLGQMHERYLIWGGAVTAVAVAISLRTTLLHVLFTALSTVMIGHVMLLDKKLPPTLGLIAFLNTKEALGAVIFLGASAAYLGLMARPLKVSVCGPDHGKQTTGPLRREMKTRQSIEKVPRPIVVVSPG